MKKTLAIVAFVAAMLVAGKAQAQLSINLGYAPETLTETVSNSGNSYYTNMTGFFAGATYNMDLYKGLGLAVGAQIRWNSDSGSSSSNLIVINSNCKYTTNQFLIDVPVLLNYGYNFNRDLRLAAFVGPTINFGIYGQTKVTTNVNSIIGSGTDVDIYDFYDANSYNFKRFNLSGTAGLAFSFKQFRIFGGYNFGLLNLSNNANYTAKTAAPFFGLSYTL